MWINCIKILEIGSFQWYIYFLYCYIRSDSVNFFDEIFFHFGTSNIWDRRNRHHDRTHLKLNVNDYIFTLDKSYVQNNYKEGTVKFQKKTHRLPKVFTSVSKINHYTFYYKKPFMTSLYFLCMSNRYRLPVRLKLLFTNMFNT